MLFSAGSLIKSSLYWRSYKAGLIKGRFILDFLVITRLRIEVYGNNFQAGIKLYKHYYIKTKIK